MPQCAVATCRNSHRRTRGRRIRYHRFPQIPEVRSRWVRACGRVPLSNGDVPFNIQTARICSLHFTHDSYEKDMEHLVLGLPVRSRLRRGAVPTIGVPVNVQPVTKMLVEDARRSILKVAQSKRQQLSGKTSSPPSPIFSWNNHQGETTPSNKKNTSSSSTSTSTSTSGTVAVAYKQEQKMAGIDVLLALGLKPASRLNKMHAMEGLSGNGTTGIKANPTDKTRDEEDTSRASPKVPQNQQNGAALPEETAAAVSKADRLGSSNIVKKEIEDTEIKVSRSDEESSPKIHVPSRTNANSAPATVDLDNNVPRTRKRRSVESHLPLSSPKKICSDARERYISSLIGCERVGVKELALKADQLRAEVQALDELARAKEMEWNEILSMRKLKEEAYLRIERRRQILGYMDSNNGQSTDSMPLASLSLTSDYRKDKSINPHFLLNDEEPQSGSKKDRKSSQRHGKASSSSTISYEQQDNRQIGEGRQGAIVDVKSIIADYRLRHPETVPRRGRRMRNSVHVGLGTGGGIVDNPNHPSESRSSSTDSCLSNSGIAESSNSMSFKDVLVQFAKLSQQQGESVKTPQNYPDVTLHPVAGTATTTQVTTSPQQTGSLLHGILTKSQSPRPTTFSPTLARLLTAPERERNTASLVQQQQNAVVAQHLLQTYQGSNPVSISDLLSSSKARTEITITPVMTATSHSNNNLIHVDDVEEENLLMDERSSRGRDREDRESPPRCQGCQERAAQFVCAGCGNQWYCSRECQVAAWDEHSEVCSG